MLRRLVAGCCIWAVSASSALAQTGLGGGDQGELPPPPGGDVLTPPSILPSVGWKPSFYIGNCGAEIGTWLGVIFALFVVVMVIFGAMRWLKRVRSA